jgi:predicted Fe-Mo cluster-binding NifX family protein
VFEASDGVVGSEKIRANLFTAHAKGECDGTHQHQEHHSHSDLVRGLEDCDVVLCQGMGWRAAEELAQNGIQPFVIGEELTPREAVARYLAGKLPPASAFCRFHE